MAAINFPSSPTNGQVFITSENAWEWDGTAWRLLKPTKIGNLLFGNISLGDSSTTASTFLNPELNVSSYIASNLFGGTAGSIPYQAKPNETGFISSGTAGQALISAGAKAPIWGSAGLINVQVFTSSGTWTKTSGTNKIIVYAQGGGGGGGGSTTATSGGGGGGGGCAIRYLDVSSISSVSVTIGTGGGGGTTGSGIAGGNTTFGTYATGEGGTQGQTNASGSGGTATNGTINLSGQSGDYTTSSSSIRSAGGSSFFGFGGMHAAGTLYGGGGAGNFSSTAASAGANGIIIVYEFS